MTRRQRWGTAALLLLGAAGVIVAQAAAARGGDTPKAMPGNDATASSEGMKAWIDPDTGRLIEPTPEQLQQLEKGVAQMLAQPAEGLEVVTLPDGTLTIDLAGASMEVAVAAVMPDGSVRTGCVDGPGQVKHVLGAKARDGKKPAPPAAPLEVR